MPEVPAARLAPDARILIVRLGALGDIVHALPAVAALRSTYPRARIDWIVDARHREVLDLVPAVNRRIVMPDWKEAGVRGVLALIAELRRGRYDAALDLQGLFKSAVLARASGAARVVGFGLWHLRERTARVLYTEAHDVSGPVGQDFSPADRAVVQDSPPSREATADRPRLGEGGSPASGETVHVIRKNLALAAALGANVEDVTFPLESPPSSAVEQVRGTLGISADDPFITINPGAAWPNKRWPVDRFGAVARELQTRSGMRSIVLWGPGERSLAEQVVRHSSGAAAVSPPTGLGDVIAIADASSLTISGDTGPLHIAAARGCAVVAIFGPTNPRRNGPWDPRDRVVSRYDVCRCHYKRRCHAKQWCLDTVSVAEVVHAAAERLSLPVLSGRPLAAVPEVVMPTLSDGPNAAAPDIVAPKPRDKPDAANPDIVAPKPRDKPDAAKAE